MKEEEFQKIYEQVLLDGEALVRVRIGEDGDVEFELVDEDEGELASFRHST